MLSTKIDCLDHARECFYYTQNFVQPALTVYKLSYYHDFIIIRYSNEGEMNGLAETKTFITQHPYL